MPSRSWSSNALATGFAGAVVLSSAAVVAVLHAGCEEPGSLLVREDVVELVGGCVRADDLPVAPGEPELTELPDASDTSDAAVQR